MGFVYSDIVNEFGTTHQHAPASAGAVARIVWGPPQWPETHKGLLLTLEVMASHYIYIYIYILIGDR